jgi:quinol monooxygenase YgiN
MTKTHTVVVILEAKPGKETELKNALVNVIQPSRSEKTCLEYRVHQENNNPAQFILY